MKRLAVASAVLLCLAAFVRADDWDAKVAAYKESQKRPSLWKRTAGREELAKTRDARAIEILAQDYAKPEKPKDQVQFLVASLVTRYCNTKDFVDALEAFRTAHDRAEDAWLWYRCLQIYQNWRGVTDVVEIAKNPELDIFLRAAAIEAIANRPEPEALELISDTLNNLPDDNQRWVLVESCMNALRWKPAQIKKELLTTAERLARMLDQDAVPEHTKLVIARTFRRIFDEDHAYMAANFWLDKIQGGKPGMRSNTLAQPTFLGLQAEGNRICYVIDMSDSMLTPLTLQEKEDLRNPVTGHKKLDDPDAKPPQPDPDVAALPWDKIVTRFDAAREFLKLSLKRLSLDQYFAVVGFGTEAALLEECDGMVKVTDKRVEKVIAELDAIKPGKATPARKEGTLRGMTNLHGGIQRAFKCKGKGLIKDYEYIDWLGFTQGADTIFLLSDGKQTWSDWDCLDKSDSTDVAGDPESGKDIPGGGDYPELHFYGPYVDQRHMLEDFQRMNLFRKAEIHCIGIGEAEEGVLRAISDIGNGQLRLVGKK
ncbi:MAG: hypothetical protein H6839_16135 [Planctomycetes bacterium]|nr:hypothetical protein [Planctomycetota bacterium]